MNKQKRRNGFFKEDYLEMVTEDNEQSMRVVAFSLAFHFKGNSFPLKWNLVRISLIEGEFACFWLNWYDLGLLCFLLRSMI